MKFSPEFIERVSEANNIVDIISQYTQLKPAGGGFMGRCPFPDHPEKTPSFSVSELKQVYHCFGCHKKGNIFSFLQNYNGMSFREAIEYLADRASIALPQVDEAASHKQDLLAQKKRLLAQANKLALQYYRDNFRNLPAQHPAKQYAHKRGLKPETLETFHVGYANEEWDGLVLFLEKNKIPMQIAEEARLIKARTGGKTGYFDLFRERLIFPIFSTTGEPIAFGGRLLVPGEPKYLNSPETALFHKGRVLYGLSETAKFIRTEDQAIVVEGYMDLVSLYQNQIQNVVATMGTALTIDHGKLLSRMTQNVVVLFDGDQAGQTAAERSLPLLLASNVYPKGLTLPDNMDPDDFVKNKGRETLLQMLAQAKDLYLLILASWMQDYRGEPTEKVQLCDRLKPIFAAIQDRRLHQLYISETAAKMRVDIRWLQEALKSDNRNFTGNFSAPSATSNTVPKNNLETSSASALSETVSDFEQITLKGATAAENLLLSLALKSTGNFRALIEKQGLEIISHHGILSVLKRAEDVYRQVPEKFDKLPSLLASYVDRPELLIADTSQAPPSSRSEEENDQKLLLDCLRKIKEQHLTQRRKVLMTELSNKKGMLSAEENANILKELADIKKEELSLRT